MQHSPAGSIDLVRPRSIMPAEAPSLGGAGYEVRLALKPSEIEAAQSLRYEVFRTRASACISGGTALRDADEFDSACAHIIVLDRREHEACEIQNGRAEWRFKESARSPGLGCIAATCRIAGRLGLDGPSAFWSGREFEIAGFLEAHRGSRIFELGRVCVRKEYRGGRVLEALLQGIWTFCLLRRADFIVGCASFEKADIALHTPALAFLREQALAPAVWGVNAISPAGAARRFEPPDMKAAAFDIRALPPLIRGYLKLGALFCEGAAEDPDFDTTDVFTILRVSDIGARYVRHLGTDAGSRAA